MIFDFSTFRLFLLFLLFRLFRLFRLFLLFRLFVFFFYFFDFFWLFWLFRLFLLFRFFFCIKLVDNNPISQCTCETFSWDILMSHGKPTLQQGAGILNRQPTWLGWYYVFRSANLYIFFFSSGASSEISPPGGVMVRDIGVVHLCHQTEGDVF